MIYMINFWTFVGPYLRRSFFSHNPSPLSSFVWNIYGWLWGRGITVQQHVIWSVHLSPIIYNLQKLHPQKRILVSYFSAYNLYFHLPIVITSGISIVISINFTRVYSFLSFYMSINTVSQYLVLLLLHSI